MTKAKKQAWMEGAKITLTAMLVFALTVIVVSRYGKEIEAIDWSLVALICMFGFGFYMFYRWASQPNNTFEPLDLILEPITRRVSLWRVLLVVIFGVGVWILVQWVITKSATPGEITALFIAIAGGIVLKVMNGEWTDVAANRQPVKAPECNHEEK